MSEAKRTLIVKFQNGEVKRLTIPENWTVTFSSFIPKMNERGHVHGSPSLRIYGPRKIQMGCLVGVESFRDEAIEVEALNKSELDDLYWKPQIELDLAPQVIKGEVKESNKKILRAIEAPEMPRPKSVPILDALDASEEVY